MYNTNKKLKVNPLFYRNFSKWLRRETLNFKTVNKVTRTVLDKIKSHPLTLKDTTILLSLDNTAITHAVLRNTNVPFKVKYKYFLKKKLFVNTDSISIIISLRDEAEREKLRNNILKHFEKVYFGENGESNSIRILEALYRGNNNDIPLRSIVKHTAVKELIKGADRYRYSWSSYFEYPVVLNKMSASEIEKYVKELIITSDDVIKVIDRWCNWKYEGTKKYKYFNDINTLDIVEDKLSEIYFNIDSDDTNELGSILKCLYSLIRFELVDEEKIKSIIKSLNIVGETNNWISFMLHIIKKESAV